MRRLVLALVAACCLYSCGSNNTFSPITQGPGGCSLPAIASKLLGKVWIGTFDCSGTKRVLRLTFTASGCNVFVNGQGLIYNGTAFPSFPATEAGTADQNTGVVTPVPAPVTISGNQATFSPVLLVNNPSGNQTTRPQGGILIVPGTSFAATYSVTISDGSLTGSYTTVRAAPANQQGSICFVPETVSAPDLSGRWTGVVSAVSGGVGAGTLDMTVAQSGNVLSLAADGAFTDTDVTVKLSAPGGVSGLVIGNQVLFGISFIRVPGPQVDQLQHRWFFGTITGNTISGEFSDTFPPLGQGTFTITRAAAGRAVAQHR